MDIVQWAHVRETHPIVAAGIHALATPSRSAHAIWESPSDLEWAGVVAYVRQNGTELHYTWGQECIQVEDFGGKE